MRGRHNKGNNMVLLPAICLAILSGLFLAGLWPLNFHPENKVTWLPGENGIRFHGFGMAYSPGPLISGAGGLGRDGPVSIELRIRPLTEPGNRIARIVSLYDGRDRETFLIGQWRSHLVIQTRAPGRHGGGALREIGLREVLTKGDERFVAIVSAKGGTWLSVDGRDQTFFPGVSLLSGEEENSGALVVGTSPDGRNAWEGDLFRLAVHDRFLSPEEVSRHSRTPDQEGNPLPAGESVPFLSYGFAEREGTITRNEGDSRYPLLIPDRFHRLRKTILVPPWHDFRFDVPFLADAAINILGFIPFGYVFLALLKEKTMPLRLPSPVVVLLMGCGISLAIELLQVYLPQRNSSLTDVLCNILGTTVGIGLFLHAVGMRKGRR